MGEWQAWHPTVSRQSRSTDITDGLGPGTRWSAGPESYIDEVVAASPMFRVPSGPPARRPGLQCFLALVSLSWCLRAAARPRDRHTRACGSEWSISKPGQALPPPSGTRECTLARWHPPHWWRGCVAGGQALRSRRHPPHWWRGCVVSGQARTWRIHGLGAELPCTRGRVRKCDGLNVSEPTEHSTIARGAHAVE